MPITIEQRDGVDHVVHSDLNGWARPATPDESALWAYKDARIERLEEALHRIVQWADAYPLDVFPEPDFKKVNEVLKAAGLSLDQVSASNMRHVVNGVGDIARSAQGKPVEQP